MPAPDDYTRQILRLEKFLRAYLHRFAPQAADIDDLLQETYTHLFKLTPAQRAAISNIEGFAVRSARNVAMDWMRRRRVVSMESVEELSELPMIDDTERLEEIAHRHQQLTRVIESIAGLPERCRQIFTLRRVYGLSQKEIARRLGIGEGTVEQQLVKGVKHCAAALREESAAEPETRKPRIGGRKPGEAR